MARTNRRDVLKTIAGASLAAMAAPSFLSSTAFAAENDEPAAIAFGLVTYMWGADWDLPTLLKNCKETGVQGVELRTTHKHMVEPSLSDEERAAVASQFGESGITLVGIGSDERFDNPDPAKVKAAIEKTKEFIRLSHDIGGSGVKVKPDRFYDEVPREKTIEQIGKALNELGEYAAGFGQQVRLEVHGQCSELPTIKAIMDIATDENVYVCWNSNATDLKGDGLKANFDLVRSRFGSTCHVRELDTKDYPFADLVKLLVASKYEGWVLLEAASKQEDRIAALVKQRKLFDDYMAAAAK